MIDDGKVAFIYIDWAWGMGGLSFFRFFPLLFFLFWRHSFGLVIYVRFGEKFFFALGVFNTRTIVDFRFGVGVCWGGGGSGRYFLRFFTFWD